MDFHPLTYPSPSIFSILTERSSSNFFQQSLHGGIKFEQARRGDFGDMLIPPSDPMILRELEKDRIREELIATEIRRRELEEEVRRELAMEWSDPRVSRMGVRMEGGALDRLPFQRPTVPPRVATKVNMAGFHGGKKFISLPQHMNPMTHVAGTKRKSVFESGKASSSSKEVVGRGKTSSSSEKETDNWRCVLCQISTTSQQGLDEHLRGKKHVYKLKLAKREASKKAKLKLKKRREMIKHEVINRLPAVETTDATFEGLPDMKAN